MPRSIAASALLLGAWLLLLPPAQAIEPDSNSAVDIAFLRARLAARPDDAETRLRLAGVLSGIGQAQEARDLLRNLRSLDPGVAAASESLLLNLEWQLYNARTAEDPRRGEHRRSLERGLERALRRDLPAMDFEHLADLSLQLERPALAADFYRQLSHRQPVRAAFWLSRAAQWQLAAGQPLLAAENLVLASTLRSAGEHAEHYALKSLDAALASGDPHQAFALAGLILQRMPGQANLRLRAVEVAESVGRHEVAMDWLAPLSAPEDASDQVLRRQRDLALAAGELSLGLAAAQRLQRRHPDDRELRAEIARLYEWNQQPREALREWRRLALDGSGDLRALGRAAELHAQLGETKQAAALLALRLEIDPDEHPSRVRLAQFSEWGGDPAQALFHWRYLLRHRAAAKDEQEVARLAPMLRDHAALVELWRWREARRALTPEEYRELTGALIASGDPGAGRAALRRAVQRYPAELALWQQLAEERERAGELAEALAVWDDYETRRGADDISRLARARLLLALDRLVPARRLAPSLDNTVEAQLLAGEIAWRAGDVDEAARRYAALWQADQRDAVVIERHIALTRQTQGWRAANRLRLAVWQRPGQGYRLQSALADAEREADWREVRRLLGLAAQRPEMLASEGYWLTTAAVAEVEGDRIAAQMAYARAVAINPNSEARVALLWLLIDNRERDALRSAMQRWEEAAEGDRLLWPAFAAGLLQLGQPQAALRWYRRLAAESEGDPLWQLDFADALAAAGHRDSAFRVSRYALRQLGAAGIDQAANVTTGLDLRLVAALESHWSASGADTLMLTYEERAATLPPNAGWQSLAEWQLRRERISRARRWLAARHRARLENPAWLEMAVALADDDSERIEALLASRERELAPLQYSLAERRLGRPGAALNQALLALEQGAGFEAVGAIASLRAERPRDVLLQSDWQELGGLDVQVLSAQLRLSGDRDTWSLRLAEAELDGDAALSGDERGVDLDWHRHSRWGRSTVGIGWRETLDESVRRWRLAQRWSLSENWQISVAAEDGQISQYSEALRARAQQRSLSLALSGRPGGRNYLDAELARERQASLPGARLARGWRLSLDLGRELGGPHHSLRLGLRAGWLENDLDDALPAELAADLPGQTLADVVPKRFASIGLGARLARGNPGADYPQTGGLRYFADLWLGLRDERSQAFSGDFAATLSAGVAGRVFGGDELGASLLIDEARSERDRRISLWYRRPF